MVLTDKGKPRSNRPHRSNRHKSPRPESARPDKPGLKCRMAATTLLTRVIDDQRSLDGLLDTRHGPKIWHNLEPVDKALARAIVTTALRHRGEIDYHLAKCLDRKLPKNARHLQHTLHVAAAQILFMNVPDSAAVDLAVTALRADPKSTRFANLGNAVLRRLSTQKPDPASEDTSTDEIAKANMAPWLWKRMRKDYGREKAYRIATAHMIEPIIDITVKSDAEGWAEKLGGTVLFGNTIRTVKEGAITDWPGYDDGEWWVQDGAASLSADRLKRLEQNFSRLNLQARFVNADLFEWQPDSLFDGILLDAPCSSTGTIRRHPDVQWTKDAEQIEELAALQKKMIVHAIEFLKPGGMLVFSNCSIDRAEGEDTVAQLLSERSDLQLDPIVAEEVFGLDEIITRQGTIRTLPFHMDCKVDQPSSHDMSGLDGFFAARFIKTE